MAWGRGNEGARIPTRRFIEGSRGHTLRVSRGFKPQGHGWGKGRESVHGGVRWPLMRVDNRTIDVRVASNSDFNLETFSHNPVHGSFAPLAFPPSTMTNYANQQFFSY